MASRTAAARAAEQGSEVLRALRDELSLYAQPVTHYLNQRSYLAGFFWPRGLGWSYIVASDFGYALKIGVGEWVARYSRQAHGDAVSPEMARADIIFEFEQGVQAEEQADFYAYHAHGA